MSMMDGAPKKSSKSDNQANQGSDNLLHGDLTRRIIGCAMRVHSTLGSGFQEVIYQRALAIEMNFDGLNFEREKEMPIFYRDQNIGSRRADFFVEDVVMVELKAISQLEDVHLAQAMNYLEAYGIEIGLLINFGGRSLEFKRIHLKRSEPGKDV
jgi:GxxExxY protein